MAAIFCLFKETDSYMNWKKYVLILALASISVLGYVSVAGPAITFPLDDAWIHQAYARNLANNGEWAFISGEISTGATSILWVFILAIGYLINIDPVLWSTILGILLLSGIAVLAWKLADHYLPDIPKQAWLFVIIIVFEWHLLWAALSGMETLLFSFLVTLLLTRLLIHESQKEFQFNYWLTNTLILAAIILTRPDGLSLLGPSIAFIWLSHLSVSEKWKTIASHIGGLFIILLPFILFNYSVSGSIFPNTFYAKQAEYAALLQNSLSTRVLSLIKLPLVGVGTLLLPGFIYISFNQLRRKKWSLPLVSLWILAFISLYALRLPLDFQHGRYMMPIMPIYLILGAIGSFKVIRNISNSKWRSIIARVISISALVVLIIFWFLGRNAFLKDTQFIQSQMLDTAHWINQNIDPAATLAAHDIGALGYVTQRPIIDLAGLILPEIIPIIRDEEKIAEYLDKNDVAYLIIFPDWYSNLTISREIIYQSQGAILEIESQNFMAIYKWP